MPYSTTFRARSPGPRTIGLARGVNSCAAIFRVVSGLALILPASAALDSSLPPGRNFDLSHWYLTLPDVGPPIIEPDQLVAGYTNAAWFYTGADGSMVFFAPVTGGTTQGSDYPRSELRERLDPTTNSVNWTVQGTHLLNARCRVTQVPSGGRVIIGQIHSYLGNAYPLIKLTYDNGLIDAVVKVSPNDSAETHHLFNPVALNESIAYQIKLADGIAFLTVNGITQTLEILQRDPEWAQQTFYFKAGSYCQDNSGPVAEGGRIAFYFLEALHPVAITTAPSIAVPPEDLSVPEKGRAGFNVIANGAPPLSYQWLKNGNALDGAINNGLVMTNVQREDAGNYAVVVSNAFGAVTSAVGRLTLVLPPPLTVRAASTNALPGTQVLIPLRVSQFTNISSFQFSLHWNPADASFVGLEQFGVPGLAAGNFGTNLAANGLVTVSWDDASGTNQTVRDGTTLFALRLQLIGQPGRTSSLVIDGNPTMAEASDANLRLVDLALLPGQLSIAATLPAITLQPVGQTIGAGSNATLRVAATGTAPMSYQWRCNGQALLVPTATQATLALTNVRPSQAGAYSVVISNAAGCVTSSVVSLAVTVSLAEALDTTTATWSTSGTTPLWAGQTAVTHDGVDAAQSGAVADGKSTTVQTSMTGPGSVSFCWKVSSETNNDVLIFYINSTEKARLSGEVDWRRQTFEVGSGTQTLKWTYLKNKSLARGQDRAWLDEVKFSPEAPPSAPSGLVANPVSINRIDLRWTDNSLEESSFNLERSTNGVAFTRIATLGANITNYAHGGLLAGQTCYYRVNAANSLGTSPYSEIVKASPLEVTNAKINFQPASAAIPAGYLPDSGSTFGDRGAGLAYGWNVSNTSNTRDRNSSLSPDQRYDTSIPVPKNTTIWELALPRALYDVVLVAGDPGDLNSDFRFNVEGVPAINGRPSTTNRWLTGKVSVPVLDGRLTVSNAPGAVNNKLCFIDVTRRSPLLNPPADKMVELGSAWNFDPPTGAVGLCTGSNLLITIASTLTNTAGFCGGTFQAVRTWNVSGPCAASSTCRQTVTVIDRTPPTLFFPPDRTVEFGSAWSFEPPSAAEEIGLEVFFTSTNVLCGNSFVATRVWIASDLCGNQGFCTNVITVLDTTPPVLRCGPGRTVELGVDWNFDTPSLGDPIADAGATITVVTTVTNWICGNSFSATRTWNAADACGLSSRCAQTIAVMDLRPPWLSCPPNRVVGQGSDWDFGTPTIVGSPSGDDVVVSVVDTKTNVLCGNVLSMVRTWSALDRCGNSNTCAQFITVRDPALPSLAGPPDRTIEAGIPWTFDEPLLDSTGETTVTLSILETRTNALCGNSFVATRVWVATDECGNSNSCAQKVIVSDTLPPIIVCAPDRMVEAGRSWDFDLPAAIDLGDGARLSLTVLSTVTNGLCGNTFVATRTWAAMDRCGQSSSCSQTVVLIDSTPPTLLCRDLVTCNPTAAPLPTVSDNDDPAPLLACVRADGRAMEELFPEGTVLVNCTALDSCGNSNGCTFSVTVLPGTAGSALVDRTVRPGSDVVFAEIVIGSGPYIYRWTLNGTAIEGALGSRLTLTNVSSSAGGLYCVEITGACQVMSYCATLTVLEETVELCTGMQAFYANPEGGIDGLSTAEWLAQQLAAEPLLLGKVESRFTLIGLDDLPALLSRLPAGGLATNLASDGGQPFSLLSLDAMGKLDNALLGETIALTLNCRLDPRLPGLTLTPVLCTRSGDSVRPFSVPTPVLEALVSPGVGLVDPTVAGLLELANRALAGEVIDGLSLDDILQALQSINAAFDGCTILITCEPSS